MKLKVVIILFIISNISIAGGSGGNKFIEKISVNGPYQHYRFVISDGYDPDGCKPAGSSISGYTLDKTSPKYKELYSTLLSAAVTKKEVSFYLNGCLAGEPKIENITVTF